MIYIIPNRLEDEKIHSERFFKLKELNLYVRQNNYMISGELTQKSGKWTTKLDY